MDALGESVPLLAVHHVPLMTLMVWWQDFGTCAGQGLRHGDDPDGVLAGGTLRMGS